MLMSAASLNKLYNITNIGWHLSALHNKSMKIFLYWHTSIQQTLANGASLEVTLATEAVQLNF